MVGYPIAYPTRQLGNLGKTFLTLPQDMGNLGNTFQIYPGMDRFQVKYPGMIGYPVSYPTKN